MTPWFIFLTVVSLPSFLCTLPTNRVQISLLSCILPSLGSITVFGGSVGSVSGEGGRWQQEERFASLPFAIFHNHPPHLFFNTIQMTSEAFLEKDKMFWWQIRHQGIPLFRAILWIREATSVAEVWRSAILHWAEGCDRGWKASKNSEESECCCPGYEIQQGSGAELNAEGSCWKERGWTKNIFDPLITWAKSTPAPAIIKGVRDFCMLKSAFLWFIVKCWSRAPL